MPWNSNKTVKSHTALRQVVRRKEKKAKLYGLSMSVVLNSLGKILSLQKESTAWFCKYRQVKLLHSAKIIF